MHSTINTSTPTETASLIMLQPVIPTWGNHNFVFFSSDPEEREVVVWVEISHAAPGFLCQRLYHTGILHGGRVVQGRTDWNAWKYGGIEFTQCITLQQ